MDSENQIFSTSCATLGHTGIVKELGDGFFSPVFWKCQCIAIVCGGCPHSAMSWHGAAWTCVFSRGRGPKLPPTYLEI